MNGSGSIAVPVGQMGPQHYILPDLRRLPGRSFYTGLQDPVVTDAAGSGSDPTTTAAWYVTIGAQRRATSRVDNVGPVMEKCEVMDRVVEVEPRGELNMRDPAVQMASRVVLSVVEQACEVLDSMRMHAAECKDTSTMAQILDLLDDAEMAFEKVANTWRAGIAVAEAQGEPWWAYEAAISCLVESLRLMRMAFEKGQQNQLSSDDNG